MNRRLGVIFSCLFAGFLSLAGQDTDYGPGYQAIMMNNPGFTGSSGIGQLRLSYLNFYPGNNYNLHSVFISFDSFFQQIHGGAGFYLANDYLGGIINDTKGAFSYSYYLQADRNFYINAGLSAGFYHRGFNFGNAVFPDQISSMGIISEGTAEIIANSGRIVFDVGTGFVFIWEKLYIGLSALHLAEPDLAGGGLTADRLRRKYMIYVAGDLLIDTKNDIMIRPVVNTWVQGKYFSFGSGALLESKHLSVNLVLMTDNNKNIDMQTGLAFNYGRMTIFYNYRFSLKSENSVLPFSLVHQPGISFSLNNLNGVEKRLRYKTIKLPGM